MPRYELVIKARYYLDPATFTVAQGRAVCIDRGRVARVCPHDAPTDAARELDYGDAVILPAFVNAHAHLDLSHMRELHLTGENFSHWLRCVVEARSAAPGTIVAAVEQACRDMLASGTASVLDILATTPYAYDVARVVFMSGLRAIEAVEMLALDPAQAGATFEQSIGLHQRILLMLLEMREEDMSCYIERILDGARAPHVALSPHAPYTTSANLYELIARYAERTYTLQTTHLGESPAEREFLMKGTGRFKELFEALKFADGYRAPGTGPLEYWTRAAAAHEQPGLNDTVHVHCYDLHDDEVADLGRRGASVAYCPRSRAFFGHPAFHYRVFADAGCNVCLGTDSLASNDSLDMLDELASACAEQPDVPVTELWRAATINGRAALQGAPHKMRHRLQDVADLHVRATPGGSFHGDAGPLLHGILNERPPSLATIVDGKLVHQHV